MLDCSCNKQTELLDKLRRDSAEVVTAKKGLEMQKQNAKGQNYITFRQFFFKW